MKVAQLTQHTHTYKHTRDTIILGAKSSASLPGRGCEGGKLTERRVFHRLSLWRAETYPEFNVDVNKQTAFSR